MNLQISWKEFHRDCHSLAFFIKSHPRYSQHYTNFYAIPRGGFFVAAQVAYILDIKKDHLFGFTPSICIGIFDFIIDDIFDKGKTYQKLAAKRGVFAALYAKSLVDAPLNIVIGRKLEITKEWVDFPWDLEL